MKFLWFIAALSAAMLAAALAVPGLADYALLAAPCLAASIYLMLHTLFLAPDAEADRQTLPAGKRGARPRPAPDRGRPWIVVDGSNVMHWNDGKPALETLRLVLAELAARGFAPCVIFDANAGWKLHNRYLDDRSFALQLDLPEQRILVVPKGTQADRYILEAARNLGARIVTNDRFRDWAPQFPELRDPDLLIRGGAHAGRVWLDDTARAGAPAASH